MRVSLFCFDSHWKFEIFSYLGYAWRGTLPSLMNHNEQWKPERRLHIKSENYSVWMCHMLLIYWQRGHVRYLKISIGQVERANCKMTSTNSRPYFSSTNSKTNKNHILEIDHPGPLKLKKISVFSEFFKSYCRLQDMIFFFFEFVRKKKIMWFKQP